MAWGLGGHCVDIVQLRNRIDELTEQNRQMRLEHKAERAQWIRERSQLKKRLGEKKLQEA